MKKLYLIRRRLESFVGPMTAEQLKASLQRLEFGLQDEVSGHCGRWIILENKKQLKSYYPEVYTAIFQGEVGPWAEPTGLTKKPAKVKNKKNSNNKVTTPNKNKESKTTKGGMGLAVFFLFGALTAAMVALYIVKPSLFTHFIDRVKVLSSKPSLEMIQSYFDAGDLKGYTEYIRKYKGKILEDVHANSKLDKESPWLPYLRFYAFHDQGKMSGLSNALLKGPHAVSAPTDCTLDSWKSRFKDGMQEWSSMVYTRELTKNNWGRLLAWDPHWIKRRVDKGWIEPINYYGACIYMAYRAFEDLINDKPLMERYTKIEANASEVISVLKSRLGWLSYLVNQTETFDGIIAGQTDRGFLGLSYWTCIEAAESFQEMESCKKTHDSQSQEWQDLDRDRLSKNILRLALDNPKHLNKTNLEKIQNSLQYLMKNGPFTRLDYRAEVYLAEELMKADGNVEAAIESTKKEFKFVDFSKDFLK
ncbi:MAG: hypothetical protein R3B45_12665 [Bdellovibrionota bacterium]